MNKYIEQVEAYHQERGIKVNSTYPDDWRGEKEYDVYFRHRRIKVIKERNLIK